MSQRDKENTDYYRKPDSNAMVAFMYMLLADVFIYQCVVPLLAVWVACSVCKFLSIQFQYEMVATCLITFVFIYCSFCIVGESHYWRHLFAFEHAYCNILIWRDLFNTFMIVIIILSIGNTIGLMVEDKAMKTFMAGEGTGFYFMKTVGSWFGLTNEDLAEYGFKLPHASTLTDPNFGENERFEHAGAFMLFWSMLTACIAKVLYFNTLFTYLRAMEIFMSLRPTFMDDDDLEENESEKIGVSNMSFYKNDHPSQLEQDVSRAAKKTNWN